MRFNPTTETTMLDWIIDVIPRDRSRKPFRKAMSPKLTEEQVYANVLGQLAHRKVGLCDISIHRRKDDKPFRRPTDERILKRYIDI